MKLPTKIIVCGHEIQIRHKTKLIVNGAECWGLYHDEANTIYLKSGMSRDRKLEILLHEVIHVIEAIHVLDLTEKAVRILAIEILAFVVNNRIRILERRKVAK